MSADEIKFSGKGLSGIDLRDAGKLFKEYLKQYSFTQLSDIQLVEELVYREIMQNRFKEKIDNFEKKHKKEGHDNITPSSMLQPLNENFEQILKLKESLGLLKDKTSEDGFQYIQKLKEKFKVWANEHQGSRYLKCPHCSKPVLLKIRTESWEAAKHPFFKDNILGNDALVKLFQSGKITKKDVADILQTSPDYTDWLISKWNLISKPETTL